MSTEDKKPCLQGFIPSWSFLTRLRRPHLFSHKRKDGGEKSAWTRLVRAVSDFRRGPSFQASFHTILTLRASWYAPPDTEVPNLQPVALEQLLSIEGTVEIQMDITFSRGPCRGGALLRPCRRHWFYDNFRRIRIALQADVGIGPYGSIIRNLAGGAEPRPYNLPRKKVTRIRISAAPSIDGNRSKETSCKFDAFVSGGAY